MIDFGSTNEVMTFRPKIYKKVYQLERILGLGILKASSSLVKTRVGYGIR